MLCYLCPMARPIHPDDLLSQIVVSGIIHHTRSSIPMVVPSLSLFPPPMAVLRPQFQPGIICYQGREDGERCRYFIHFEPVIQIFISVQRAGRKVWHTVNLCPSTSNGENSSKTEKKSRKSFLQAFLQAVCEICGSFPSSAVYSQHLSSFSFRDKTLSKQRTSSFLGRYFLCSIGIIMVISS